ncbi:MAG: ABC transporter substrate-binding protein [Micromonosporaceae bacterium]
MTLTAMRTRRIRRRGRQALAVFAAAATVAATLVGCGGSESHESSGGAKHINLAVQGNIIPTNIALVADKLGLYRKYGITVKTTLTKTSANAVAGMMGGSIDLSLVGFDFATANEKGADTITVGATSNTGLWTYAAKKGIENFKDLEGKRIAVSGPETMSAVALQLAAEQAGADFDSMKLVPAGSTPDRYAALKAGRVDAASLGAPFTEQAATEGFNELGYAEEGQDAPALASGIFIAAREYASTAQGKEAITRFLAAILEASAWAHDSANLDKLSATTAKLMGAKEPLVKEAWKKAMASPMHLPEDGKVDLEAARNAAQAFVDFGAMRKLPDMNRLVDNSFVEAASKRVKK